MTQYDNTERDDRQERYQRRRTRADNGIQDSMPRQRRIPYKREQVDYDDYLQEELEDE